MLRWQQLLLGGLAVAASAALLPDANDAAMLVKFVALVVVAGLLAGLAAARVVVVGDIGWRRHPVVPAAVALAVVALLASAWSPQPVVSLVGAYGRYAGGIGYAAAMVVLLAVVWTMRLRDLPRLVVALLVGTAVTVGYGALQLGGADPLTWDNPEFVGRVLGTFGNPDFAAAMLAIGLPLAAWGAVASGWNVAARTASGVLALGTVAAIAGTGELQGWFAGLAGAAVLLVAWVLERPPHVRRVALPVTWAVLGLGALVAVLDATGVGPLRVISQQSTFRSRTLLWRTGWRQFVDAPLTGQGLDRYADVYNEFRPFEETLRRPLTAGSDAAHDVVLNLLAGGGIAMGLAFVALVAVVAWALVIGLRETEGADRLLVGALGGAWVAYQAQALVSVEIPPLLAVHALVAGGVVVAGTPPERVRHALPAGPAARWAVAPLGAVVVLASLWFGHALLRADLALREGQKAVALGDVVTARAEFDRAIAAAPWEDQYPLLAGVAQLNDQLDQLRAPGLAALAVALERNPRNLSAAVTLGRVATESGDADAAQERYEAALAVEPHAPALWAEYALAMRRLDRPEQAAMALDTALGLGERALELGLTEQAVPAISAAVDAYADPALRLLLAEAHLATGDLERARAEAATVQEQAPRLPGLDELLARLG